MRSKKTKRKNKSRRHKKPLTKVPTISVCMIVKDEEKFLPQCLESIKGIADEIVIVDTGSTDRSIEIAESFGAKVYQHPWENDFAKHRNQSLIYATGDWIFLIDADEAIPQKERKNLKRAILNPVADAYRLTTRNYKPTPNQINTFETKGDYPEEKGYKYWVPSTKIRLFRRDENVCFEGAVHELVEPSLQRLGFKIEDLDVPILHFGDIEKDRGKARYLEFARAKVKRFPDSPQALFELALIESNTNHPSKALGTIEKAITLFQQGHKDPYLDPAKLFLLKGNILTALGKNEEATAAFKKALAIRPDFYEAMNNIGICYENMGDFDSSEHWYKHALAISKQSSLILKNLNRVQVKRNSKRTLSVCMIVKNEAQRIERAIRSVLPFADEVVVVDTGSTDETVEIAKRLGARIGYFEWCDDFSAARNVSLDLATGDWIMWIDADDHVPPTEWRRLQDLKLLEPNQAFMFRLKTVGAENTTSWQLRMFPRNKHIRFSSPVHEQITPSIISLQLPIKKAEITIIHTGYSDPETIRIKRERNLRILKEAILRDPSDTMVRFHLAYSYFSLGQYEHAKNHFKKVVKDEVFKRRFTGGYAAALTYLGRAFLMLNQNKMALEPLAEALELDRNSHLVRVYLATCYNRIGQPKKALELLEAKTTEESLSIVPVDIDHLEYLSHLQKALAFENLGRLEQALIYCKEAQKLCPHSKDAQDVHFRILEKIKDLPKEIDILEHMFKSDSASAQDLYLYGITLINHGQVSDAMNAFRSALEKDARHIGARRSLATILKHRSCYEEAKQVLLQGLDFHPTDKGLVTDLTDVLFMLEDWPTIIKISTSYETLPTRLASKLIGGIDEGIDHDIVALFKLHAYNIEELDRDGVAALWRLARTLQDPARFHLAVACFWLEPSLKQAAEVAINGFLARGMREEALKIAEYCLSVLPEDPDARRLASRCLENDKASESVGHKLVSVDI